MKKQYFLIPILALLLMVSSCSSALEACFGTIISGTSVEFNATCSVGATSYSWDFGDGGKSSLAGPTHEYSSSGSYTVKLTVENKNGKTEETTRTISI